MRGTPSRTGTAFVVALLVAITFGCERSPASPTFGPPIPSPPAVLPPQTLTVVSGWDRTPVAGATVRLDGVATSTNTTGEVSLPAGAPSTMTVDVDAAGFLPHRTRLSVLHWDRVIHLWPAANETETAAIRDMVFFEDRRTGVHILSRLPWRAYYLALLVDGNPRPASEIVAEWAAEYQEIEELTRLPLDVTFSPKGVWTDGFEEEVIVVLDRLDSSCRDPWGFCSAASASDPNRFPYFSRALRLASDRPEVIRRVLAYGLLNLHSFPGLLNRTNPDAELSLLEKQALRMLFLRPAGTIWPDTDPSR